MVRKPDPPSVPARPPGRPPKERTTSVLPEALTPQQAQQFLQKEAVLTGIAQGLRALDHEDPEAATRVRMAFAKEQGLLKGEGEAPIPVDLGPLLERVVALLLLPSTRRLLFQRGIDVRILEGK